jgi:hypothetical protein
MSVVVVCNTSATVSGARAAARSRNLCGVNLEIITRVLLKTIKKMASGARNHSQPFWQGSLSSRFRNGWEVLLPKQAMSGSAVRARGVWEDKTEPYAPGRRLKFPQPIAEKRPPNHFGSELSHGRKKAEGFIGCTGVHTFIFHLSKIFLAENASFLSLWCSRVVTGDLSASNIIP